MAKLDEAFLEKGKMKVHIDEEKCKPCGICELACSFHHAKKFLPEYSSIRVFLGERGELVTSISSNCDGCKDEAMPLCVEFCPTQALNPCGLGSCLRRAVVQGLLHVGRV